MLWAYTTHMAQTKALSLWKKKQSVKKSLLKKKLNGRPSKAFQKFKKINQIDGNTYPEEDFLEELKFLKGFYFREDEKPNSIDDLFKDDPQLILTKIKSLEIN